MRIFRNQQFILHDLAMQQAAKTGTCIAALIILRGPDPKKAKAADTAFHKASDGVTTLSCSGAGPACQQLSAWSQKPAKGDSHAAGIVTGRLGQDCAVLVPVTAVLPFIQQAGREQLDWRDSGVLLSNVRYVHPVYQQSMASKCLARLLSLMYRISVAWHGLELEAKLQGQIQVAGLQSALEELLESGEFCSVP